MEIIVQLIDAVAWPLTVLIIILFFRKQIEDVLRRFKKADLPGGVSFEAFPEEVKEAKVLSDQVKEEAKRDQETKKGPSIPLTEVNARMLNLGLGPSPSGLDLAYYRVLAEQDPNLALAGMRMEVETMLKNLANGFKVPVRGRDSAGVLVRKLREHRAISSHQAELLSVLLRLCNSAVHGVKVSERQVGEILDVASVLRDQYVSWLGWGFEDGWKPVKQEDQQ
jgi:hypothetical protein